MAAVITVSSVFRQMLIGYPYLLVLFMMHTARAVVYNMHASATLLLPAES
jgi:hypothetical protein